MPGGAANRAGIGYENLWIVLRVAEMLQGKVSQMRLEPPGRAGTGIELAVVAEGVSWGEQTKDSQRSWTINRLISGGVLADAKVQIAELGRCFRFVASSAASDLGTLAYRARKSESFAEFDEAIGSGLRDHLAAIATEWDISRDDAWLLLRRVEVEHLPVDALKRIVESELRGLYRDDPNRVTDAVVSFCDQHIHETVTAPQISAHLESDGLVRRMIVGDSGVIAELSGSRERQARRVDSAKPSSGLVARADVAAVVGLLREPDGAQVVVVDGRAGYGKSTVVSEVAATLEEQGWFVAVARMDTDQSMSTSRDLGRAMGLSESPSVLLAGVSEGSPALLVVDQLDAVSSLGGRMPDNFEAVHEAIDEIRRSPNVKVLLAVRTADLEGDPRLCALKRSEQGVGQHTLGDLDLEAVREHLVANGIEPPASDSTMELLSTPLHLSVFCRLSEDAHAIEHTTLQDLYGCYTTEVRDRLEHRLGRLDWGPITGALVGHMSNNEVLAAPVGVLDSVVEQRQVRALVSESVIVEDAGRYSFFHESYFDYLFARAFVAAGGSLREFLLDSGQYLFRRAQTRQVLDHLAATDPQQFIAVVVELLEDDDIRYHLKAVVVGVLHQVDPAPEHWVALEHLAWSGSPLGARLLRLLCKPGWFDAADSLGRWEAWLEDPQRAEAARDELGIVAKHRPARVAELVRPRLEDSDQWRHCLRRIMWLSLCSELVDLLAEAITMGLFDDADRPTGAFDLWMNLHRFKDADPGGAARLIGAFLGRGLERAKFAGSGDPFKSGHLRSRSRSESVIANVARQAPAEFISHVLPFVVEVAGANLHHPHGGLPVGRWHGRLSLVHGVDNVVFAATEKALRALAEEDPARCVDALAPLRYAEIFELRFLACRALANLEDPDDAVTWLVSDQRNLMLGSGGFSKSASRDLIEQCSPGCSPGLFDALEAAILDHWPSWETGESRGYSQYELLTALDATRLSPTARQRLHELEDRFPNWQPQPQQPAVMSGRVQSPIDAAESERMSDDDWIAALRRYTGDATRWDGERFIGGAHQLASMLGGQAKDDPERFSRIALRFDQGIPEAAMSAVLSNVEGRVRLDVLTDLCEHAHRVYGSQVGQAVCSAIGRTDAVNTRLVNLLRAYASDPDPESEEARTEAFNGDYLYGGDFLTAGLNSTRGQAAFSVAKLLFRSCDHVEALMPTVDALTQDATVAVRVWAAYTVTALLNHSAPQALDLAERMFGADIAVLDADTSEDLLTHAVLRAPDRFARTLTEAISGPEAIAVRAGRVWAVARWRERLPAGIATDICALPAAARRGAVEAFASNLADSLEDLRRVVDDDDPDVQENLGIAIYRLDDVPATELEDLLDALTESSAFPQHMDSLMYALEQLPAEMPANAITACERAVEIAGADLADPSTSSSLAGVHLTTVVLRLYRQGDQDTRVRCLDIIDRLAEFNLYDLEPTLADESRG